MKPLKMSKKEIRRAKNLINRRINDAVLKRPTEPLFPEDVEILAKWANFEAVNTKH